MKQIAIVLAAAVLVGMVRVDFDSSGTELKLGPGQAMSEDQEAASTLPKPMGANPVGRISFCLVGSPQKDVPEGQKKDPKREFTVQVWYPAEARAGAEGKPAPWLPPDSLPAEEKGFLAMRLRQSKDPAANDIPKVLRTVVVHAREEVPLAAAPEKLPVLVFSAGSQTLPSTYSFLVEDLASRGFVVAGYGPTVMGHGTWKGDLTQVLDQLEAWNKTQGHKFFGRLGLDRIGAFGHSFGASAVLSVAAADKRVKAIVLIDGTGQPEETRAIPTLVLSSEGAAFAQSHPGVAHEKAKARRQIMQRAKPGIEITLLGAEHLSFTDMAVINAFCMPGDGKAFTDTTRAVVGEFFGEYLLGKHSNLIEKGSAKYPLAKIETLP